MSKEQKKKSLNLNLSEKDNNNDINLDFSDDDNSINLDLSKEKEEFGINLNLCDSSDNESNNSNSSSDIDLYISSDNDDKNSNSSSDIDLYVSSDDDDKNSNTSSDIDLYTSSDEDNKNNNNNNNNKNKNNNNNNNKNNNNNNNNNNNSNSSSDIDLYTTSDDDINNSRSSSDIDLYITSDDDDKKLSNSSDIDLYSSSEYDDDEKKEIPIEYFRNDNGKINILVAGNYNVGKSTLINAMFNNNPPKINPKNIISEEIKEVTKKKSSVSLIDTKGFLPLEKYKDLIEKRQNDKDKAINIAWVCKDESSGQQMCSINEEEKELIKMLLEYMPVIIVITKLGFDTGLKSKFKQLFPDVNVIRVQSIYVKYNDYEIRSNIMELVNLTNNVIQQKNYIELKYNELTKEAINNYNKNTEKVNILVIGKTGVGKKTLINTIFHGKLSETGNKKEITQEIQEISKESIPISIIKVEGPEYKNYKQIINDLIKIIDERNRKNETIHIAWVCIEDGGLWLEEEDEELIKTLLKYMPVVTILTKLTGDANLHKVIKESFDYKVNISRVQASFIGGKPEIKPKILDKLINITYDEISDNKVDGLVGLSISQNINCDLKNKIAIRFIKIIEDKLRSSKNLIDIFNYSIEMIINISGAFGLPLLNYKLITNIIIYLYGENKSEFEKRINSIILKYIKYSNKDVEFYAKNVIFMIIKFIGEMYLNALKEAFKYNKNDKVPSEECLKINIYNEINSNFPFLNVIIEKSITNRNSGINNRYSS